MVTKRVHRNQCKFAIDCCHQRVRTKSPLGHIQRDTGSLACYHQVPFTCTTGKTNSLTERSLTVQKLQLRQQAISFLY